MSALLGEGIAEHSPSASPSRDRTQKVRGGTQIEGLGARLERVR
jgi:hypothetical protein